MRSRLSWASFACSICSCSCCSFAALTIGTEVHPELVFEEGINQLLATHKGLAECILHDPEALTVKRGSTPAVAADGFVARRQLIEAHEQERDRIGRELHDNSSERLGLLTVQIEQLKDSIPH